MSELFAERLLAQIREGETWRRSDDERPLDFAALDAAGLGAFGSGNLSVSSLRDVDERMDALWTTRARRLVATALEIGVPNPVPADRVVVGRHDTELINAASWVLPDSSALIVINDALVVLIYEAIRIIASRAGPPGGDPPGAIADSRDAMQALLDWVRLSSHPHPVGLPLIPDQVHFAGRIVAIVEDFVIAHEVGHVLLGHHSGCAGSRQILVQVAPALASQPSSLSDRRIEEHEADAFALVTLLRQAKDKESAELPILEGARVFFALQAEVDRMVRAQHFPAAVVAIEDTHPSSAARSAFLRELVERHVGYGEVAWADSEALTTIFKALVEQMTPVTDRERTALLAVTSALDRCAVSPVPDYAAFQEDLAKAGPTVSHPLLLAALAEQLRKAEWCLLLETSTDGTGDPMQAYAQVKLIVSYAQSLGERYLFSLREMYRRAGGTVLLSLIKPGR